MKQIIINYINNIDKDNIYNYALNKQIDLTDKEIDYIYDYLKFKYEDIINHPEDTLIDAYNNLEEKTYLKIKDLYIKYKDKLAILK